jgi:hypothetical protein
MQSIPTVIQISPAFIGRVARHLLHPGFVGTPRDPSHAHTPALQVDEEQYVVSHQTAPTEYLDREEVDPSQDRHVGLNELLPGRILAPFGRWLNDLENFRIDWMLAGLPTGVSRSMEW